MQFQAETESWQSYAERLDYFFAANKVVEDNEKVTALIVANNSSFYQLLKELSFPTNPKTMTFNDVMCTLERHYVGIKNVFKERKFFYNAVLIPNESASEWYRRLKSLAIDCDFGIFLEEMLVDKFVCGFKGRILQSFYEHDENLDLLNALQIAQLHERVFVKVNDQSIKNKGEEEEKEETIGDLEEREVKEEIEQDSDDSWEDISGDEEDIVELSKKQQQEISTQQSEHQQQSTTSENSIQGSIKIGFQELLVSGMSFLKSQLNTKQQQIVSYPNKQPQRRRYNIKQKPPAKRQQKVVQEQGHHQNQQPRSQQKPLSSRQPQKHTIPAQKLNNQNLQWKQKPSSAHPQKNQKQQQNKPNQQQAITQHQQPKQKPNYVHKPPTSFSNSQIKTRSQQPRDQQQTRTLEKPINRHQKDLEHAQNSKKSTTITTNTKTTITTTTSTVTKTKKGPAKFHKR